MALKGYVMDEFMKPVLEQIEAVLGPTYMAMGLTLECRERHGSYLVAFMAGEYTFSPLTISFNPDSHTGGQALLQSAYARIDCYEFLDVSGNGWHRWIHLETQTRRLIGSDVRILERLRDQLEAFEVIDLDHTRPYILKSENLALAHEVVVKFCPTAELTVERDVVREIERYVFDDMNGRRITIDFPSDELVEGLVYANRDEAGRFQQNDHRSLEILLGEALDHNPTSGHPRRCHVRAT